jgi:hypothetical protein
MLSLLGEFDRYIRDSLIFKFGFFSKTNGLKIWNGQDRIAYCLLYNSLLYTVLLVERAKRSVIYCHTNGQRINAIIFDHKKDVLIYSS